MKVTQEQLQKLGCNLSPLVPGSSWANRTPPPSAELPACHRRFSRTLILFALCITIHLCAACDFMTASLQIPG